jgi:MFS family permease
MSNVRILFAAQVLTGSGLTAVVLFGGILSAKLSPNPSWATLPVSLAVVGMALSTIPASLLMRIVGRRLGLITGASSGIVASLLCAYAIVHSNFVLFCFGSMLYGTSTAFTMQYRFVAAESVARERASQAISYVLLGGLGSALIGPQAALAARAWWLEHEYAGSFAVVAILYALGALVLCRLHPPESTTSVTVGEGASIKELITEPILRTAILAGAIAFGVMSFIMTAAPVSMHSVHHHSVEAITWTIQSHILAMYLPSLFSGKLVARFGERAMMICGTVLLGASAVVSLIGHAVPHYWVGLMLLGAGWNFLFTAGTALLATHYTGAERHRAQGINDFVVFSSQACVSFLAGIAVLELGWVWTNLSVLPLLAWMLWIARRNEQPTRALALRTRT